MSLATSGELHGTADSLFQPRSMFRTAHWTCWTVQRRRPHTASHHIHGPAAPALLILEGHCRPLGLTPPSTPACQGHCARPRSCSSAAHAPLRSPAMASWRRRRGSYSQPMGCMGTGWPARSHRRSSNSLASTSTPPSPWRTPQAPPAPSLHRLALSNTRARCAELGFKASTVHLRLFSRPVLGWWTHCAVLSHGAEVWGGQLARAEASCSPEGSAGSAAEKLQMGFLRRLLGGSTPFKFGRRHPTQWCWRRQGRRRCGGAGCGMPPSSGTRQCAPPPIGSRQPREPSARHHLPAGHRPHHPHPRLVALGWPAGCRHGSGRPAPRPDQHHAHPPCSPRQRRPETPVPTVPGQGDPGGRHQIPAVRRGRLRSGSPVTAERPVVTLPWHPAAESALDGGADADRHTLGHGGVRPLLPGAPPRAHLPTLPAPRHHIRPQGILSPTCGAII